MQQHQEPKSDASVVVQVEQLPWLCRKCGGTHGQIGMHDGVPLHADCVAPYEADEAERNKANDDGLDF